MNGDFSIGGALWPGTSKLLEETGELQQVLGKLIGSGGKTNHYDGSDLRLRLIEEIADVIAAVRFFQEVNMTDAERSKIAERVERKFALFQQWHELPPKW
jgi:NTP pyrophosphatase (non-canonical NTP hydrolase)